MIEENSPWFTEFVQASQIGMEANGFVLVGLHSRDLCIQLLGMTEEEFDVVSIGLSTAPYANIIQDIDNRTWTTPDKDAQFIRSS